MIGTGTIANTISNFGTGSSLTVASGASWVASGSWTIASVTNSGTLQPGVSGTPLNLTGNFTQGSAGVFKTVLTSTGGASFLNITGTASLAGSVLIVPPTSIASTPLKYTIVTASAGVSGTFASVSGGTALLTPALSYDSKDAFVTLTQQNVATTPAASTTPASTTTPAAAATTTTTTVIPAVGTAQTPNEFAFATAFDTGRGLYPGPFAPALAALDTIATRPQLNSALDALTGENNADLSSLAILQGFSLINLFQQHSYDTRNVATGDDPWASGFAQAGQLSANGNAHQLTEGQEGGAVGADYHDTAGPEAWRAGRPGPWPFQHRRRHRTGQL